MFSTFEEVVTQHRYRQSFGYLIARLLAREQYTLFIHQETGIVKTYVIAEFNTCSNYKNICTNKISIGAGDPECSNSAF